MLGRLWKKVSRVVLVAACVLAFLLAVELLRAYQTLRDLHPWAGYAFVVLLAAACVWLGGRLLGGWRLRPRTLKCPDVGDLDEADARALGRYGRYLGKYLGRLSTNESLADEQRDRAEGASADLVRSLQRCTERQELTELLKRAESEQIEPLLGELDAKAEQEIRDCVRDVMIAVAASPWPLIDALIVVYRNGSMVSRITHIYNSRPALREQLSIFADTARLVATIKLAHMMRRILEKVASDVPLMGRITEALTQAVGAGVLTSAAGHAAKHRCRAFRPWNRAEAARHLAARLGDFLADCGRIASQIVLGPFGRLYQGSADALAKVGDAFKRAVEATGAAADTFIRKPVAAGGRHVAVRVRRTTRNVFRRRR
ncbi:MAG: YcjF family protein [Phycisphaerae bacterium]